MSDELRARMARLGEQFVVRTRGEVAQLRSLCQRIHGNEPAALEELEQLAHRIRGTGATLGFIPLSDCAAQMEELAEAALQSPDKHPLPGLAPRFLEQLGRLEDELSRLNPAAQG